MKKVILSLSLLLTLSSCSLVGFQQGSEIEVSINSDYNFQLELMGNDNVETSYSAYLKCVEYLDEIYEKVDDCLLNSKIGSQEIRNENSKKAHDEYWKNHDLLMKKLNKILQKEEVYEYYIAQDNSLSYYKNIKISNLFNSKSYSLMNEDEINNKGNNLINKLKLGEVEFDEIASDFLTFFGDFKKLFNANGLASIYQDLYVEDEKYVNDTSSLSQTYTTVYQTYKKIFKEALTSNYKEAFIEKYELSEADINYFLDSRSYSEKVENLLVEETALENTFTTNFNQNNYSFDYQKNYLDLIKIRREIASELNLDSYLDFVWTDTYGRDYQIEEGKTLTNNILNSSSLINLYEKFSSDYYASSYRLINQKISETYIFEILDLTKNAFVQAQDAILELKTYGNYNFEARSDKYSGSYVTDYDMDGNLFVYVSGSGDLTMIPSIVHEFGHYLGLSRYDETKEGNGFNLDICEVHSQGLEYLMNNYYGQKMSNSSLDALIDYQMQSALWTLLSGSVVSEFEYYVYTTEEENLTIENLNNEFDELTSKMGGNFSYSDIPHVYVQPGYYISYVTSIIPSLQLWAMDLETAIEIYNNIIGYGETNGFLNVLNLSGLTSPFDKKTLDTIISKLETL